MKKIDLKNKSITELNSLLVELKSKLFSLGFDLSDKKLKDVSQVKKTRKNIARVMTEISTLKHNQ